jgi:hypothetical protein
MTDFEPVASIPDWLVNILLNEGKRQNLMNKIEMSILMICVMIRTGF